MSNVLATPPAPAEEAACHAAARLRFEADGIRRRPVDNRTAVGISCDC